MNKKNSARCRYPESRPAEMLESVRRLLQLGASGHVAVVLPGHNQVKASLLRLAMRLYLPMRVCRQVDSPCFCGNFEMFLTYVELLVPKF